MSAHVWDNIALLWGKRGQLHWNHSFNLALTAALYQDGMAGTTEEIQGQGYLANQSCKPMPTEASNPTLDPISESSISPAANLPEQLRRNSNGSSQWLRQLACIAISKIVYYTCFVAVEPKI
jgi:hypothetical protein